jgi:hypothetical protein
MRVISRTSFAHEIITVHTCEVVFPVLKFNMSILRESSACTTYLKGFQLILYIHISVPSLAPGLAVGRQFNSCANPDAFDWPSGFKSMQT